MVRPLCIDPRLLIVLRPSSESHDGVMRSGPCFGTGGRVHSDKGGRRGELSGRTCASWSAFGESAKGDTKALCVGRGVS
jgi:hypothetical protein